MEESLENTAFSCRINKVWRSTSGYSWLHSIVYLKFAKGVEMYSHIHIHRGKLWGDRSVNWIMGIVSHIYMYILYALNILQFYLSVTRQESWERERENVKIFTKINTWQIGQLSLVLTKILPCGNSRWNCYLPQCEKLSQFLESDVCSESNRNVNN